MKIKAYQIDVVKADTPEHLAIKNFQKIACDVFPTIVALKIDDKSDLVEVMSLENLSAFSSHCLNNDQQKLEAVFDLLRGIWLLHQHQFYVGFLPIQKIIFLDLISKKIKVKHYLATSKHILDKQKQKLQQENQKKVTQISTNILSQNVSPQKKIEESHPIKNDEVKDQAEQTLDKKNEKFICPSQIDIHNWAIFTASLLFQFSKQKYQEKRKTHDRKNQFVVEISKMHNFYKCQELMNILIKCLNYDFQKHPKVEEIVLIFKQIIVNSKVRLNNQTIQAYKQAYQRKQKANLLQFSIQITNDVLLTDELIKKLGQHFIKNNQKHGPKTFKPLYRAIRFDFNTKTFYAQCYNYSKLLWVIDTEQSGVICFYLEPKLTFNQNEGISGSYIADPQLKSFIYSPKNQESYKLQTKQKAFKAVMGKGPIIGDGDIILGSAPNRNWSYFPKSYQHGKIKHLFLKPQFTVKNYDVYTVTF